MLVMIAVVNLFLEAISFNFLKGNRAKVEGRSHLTILCCRHLPLSSYVPADEVDWAFAESRALSRNCHNVAATGANPLYVSYGAWLA